MASYLPYGRNLKPKARNLRNDSTKAEIRLWSELLRAKTMRGYSFRRQRPVLNYIADFMCIELGLIIEVDGLSHDDENAYQKDLRREADLTANGFTVLRFQDEEVMNDLENVRRAIEAWIDDFEEKRRTSPANARL